MGGWGKRGRQRMREGRMREEEDDGGMM